MTEGWGLDQTSARIAEAVLRTGPISRADLCRSLGLSSATLTRLTRPMVAAGLLVENEPSLPSTGRPSLPLAVGADSAHFLGVKVVAEGLHAAVVDLSGRVLTTRWVRSTWPSPADAVDAIASVVSRLHDPALAGVGTSLAAWVDDGQASASDLLGWPSCPLARMVEQATGLPSVVGNDVHALTVAEHRFGAGRGTRNLVVVTIGAGIGFGLVAEDDLVGGHRGALGGIGTLRLSGGRTAGEVLTTTALAGRLSEATGTAVSPRDVDRLVHVPACGAVFDALAADLAEVVGQLVALLSPERVVVAGEGTPWLAGHHDVLAAAGGAHGHRADVVVDPSGFEAWARGAGCLAIREHMTHWATA